MSDPGDQLACGLRVTECNYVPAGFEGEQTGLYGFANVVFNDALKVEGIAVRRTLEGKPTLAWPTKDKHGERFGVVFPIHDEARVALESAIFAAVRASR